MSEPLLKTPCAFGENGNFLLERELGSGGMGGVYMGRDKMLDRPVAVKVMLKEYGADAEFVEKFKKEAQSAAKLIHPNIAQIYSYGISDGMPYIAMELVAGGSLWSLMQATPGKTDVTRTLKICQQVAQALQCSTDQGFVHGDIKPENILLDANGNAKLVDFGLAGMQKDTKEIWGTPYYIAPEKVKQEGVDFRADMYNLGGTLYHALTNVPPFDGEDVSAVVKARFAGAPKKPSEIRPDITPAVDALVMRMLELEKERRFPSFEALIEEFKKVLTSGLEQKAAPSAGASDAAVTATGKRTTMKPLRRMSTARRPMKLSAAAEGAVAAAKTADEEEESGNVGMKVVGVVLGVIALIGLIAGGLFWYVAADKKSKADQERREVTANIAQARQSLDETRKAALGFADEFAAYAGTAVATCKSTSDELKRILPDWSAELGRPVATPAGTNAPAVAVETDAEKAKDRPPVLDDMSDLWAKAVECEQCVVRIRASVSNVLVVCDGAAQVTGDDKASMERLAALSRDAADKYGAIKVSKDVESVKKAKGYIEQKGKKSIDQTINQLRIAKLEAERKAKKEAEIAEEKARQEAAAAAKAQLIETETSAARARFDQLVAEGVFLQLDWDNAIKRLKAVKEAAKTPEGGFAADHEIHKVEDMKAVQEIFRANLHNYTFKKQPLKGRTVKRIDATQIYMVRKDGKTQQTITWRKLYRECHSNLNELINAFVVRGRENGKRHLTLMEWSDAMCGAALTMRIICGEDPTAVKYGEDLVKTVAEAFPDYEKNLKAMFPDITFGSGDANE